MLQRQRGVHGLGKRHGVASHGGKLCGEGGQSHDALCVTNCLSGP